MGSDLAPLGLIAGSRLLPFVFAREARRQGRRVVAAAFEGETDPALAGEVDEIEWLRVGQLGKMIRALADRGARECVMLGQIAPKNLFDLRPDLRAMGVMLRLKRRNAHTLFGAIAEELEKDGVRLVEALPWLQPWIPAKGFAAGPVPTPEEREDVAYGLGLAREIARLEIGQSVVVKRGTALAVEGFEGTDACLERGGKLAGKDGGAVAVKVAKAGHDMRFDIPCIGPRTVETCAASGVRVLAVEAGRSLLLERDAVERLARERGVSVVAHDGSDAVTSSGS
ncbi:MAG: LpxI family protein [Verrucomicrobia bacterium]|nr:MAG: LpxI family protein [Verrucomicrobiota bacterium]